MARSNKNDTYAGTNEYGTTEPARFVADLNTRPARSFVKIEDSTAGTDLTNVRALYFATSGTVTLTDSNSNIEMDVTVVAGLVLVCEFTHIVDITCEVYALS